MKYFFHGRSFKHLQILYKFTKLNPKKIRQSGQKCTTLGEGSFTRYLQKMLHTTCLIFLFKIEPDQNFIHMKINPFKVVSSVHQSSTYNQKTKKQRKRKTKNKKKEQTKNKESSIT